MSIYGSLVRATGGMDFNATVVATDGFSIGDQDYVYDATPTAAFDIDVGGDLDGSISNAVAAINLSGTGGTEYGVSHVTISPYCSAVADLANDELDLTARMPGTIGNGISLASTETDLIPTGAATHLTGGVGDIDTILGEALDTFNLWSEVRSFVRTLTSATD